MILFTADIHIKVGQKNVPTAWALNRYELYTKELEQAQNKATLHIVGGDIFDKMPNLAELSVYFSMVSKASIDTLIYPGNHESTKKHESFFDSLIEVTESLNPKVKVVTKTSINEYGPFSILPYADLHKKDSIEQLDENLAVFTHVRGEIPPHVKPEVDLARFSKFPIVYAGDLHSHSNSQLNIVYPGSPMTTSFHRNKVDTGYLLIDDKDLTKWEWFKFNLPQLIRKNVTDPKDMLPTLFDHTIYELEGDMAALGKVENTELLDKKIVKRETEVTINLINKTLDEELSLYLIDVLALPEDSREAALEVFNAYHNKI
jgi:DNA repair exonuclease SbcCD nuclease subunit